jgi:hypothetical protein
MNENENTTNTESTQPTSQFDPPLEGGPPEPGATEIETLRAENEELKRAARLSAARDRITALLKTAGARYPELVFEAAKPALQFGEDGSVENAEAVVGEMKRRFPEQFGALPQPPIDGGAGGSLPPHTLTKEALAKMKPAEIARLDWAAVREVLAN